jgi:hypothetical protein
MPRYSIVATATVEVEMAVDAGDPAAAEAIFRDKLALNASLAGVCPTEFDVWGDTITDIEDLTVEEDQH